MKRSSQACPFAPLAGKYCQNSNALMQSFVDIRKNRSNLYSDVQKFSHIEGHGTLFSGIKKLVAGLYMTLLPEAGG
ncbi:MAG: hypothetical protein JRJ69_02140 [Deltaproteobacteria bacterium]|nr:hypothetical protein [Deltaproteobacteria bacterium]MBW1736366.1 hypothetical protein [Deltaproteobacteria bacterium]MBW1909751.1 hypothetical protein [Deltaproteobacteria bacterium]MBW2034011.1 hypothetical protein [Deltaproteobacteria bacterium]MBW2113757.1 hypothetical protein [Deltaproteobacteria bacterium]